MTEMLKEMPKEVLTKCHWVSNNYLLVLPT